PRAGGVHGRGEPGSERATWAGPRHGHPGRHAGHQRPRAAVRAVHVRDRAEVDHGRARHVHLHPRSLRRDAGAPRRQGRGGAPQACRELLIGGEWEVALSEYPPSVYGRLIAAAAGRYGVAREELLVGAGADEILDLVAKTFIPHGGAAVVPIPTYPMYGILTEQ